MKFNFSIPRTSRPTGGQCLLLWFTIACLVTSALAFSTALTGCGTTPAALSKEQKLYQVGTNIVAKVDSVASVLPPPFCSITRPAAQGFGARVRR
jgi:hypothetical protein